MPQSEKKKNQVCVIPFHLSVSGICVKRVPGRHFFFLNYSHTFVFQFVSSHCGTKLSAVSAWRQDDLIVLTVCCIFYFASFNALLWTPLLVFLPQSRPPIPTPAPNLVLNFLYCVCFYLYKDWFYIYCVLYLNVMSVVICICYTFTCSFHRHCVFKSLHPMFAGSKIYIWDIKLRLSVGNNRFLISVAFL